MRWIARAFLLIVLVTVVGCPARTPPAPQPPPEEPNKDTKPADADKGIPKFN
jgi:hypothetical protein